MYLWRTKTLARDFAEGEVSQRTRLAYLFTSLTVMMLFELRGVELGGYPPPSAPTVILSYIALIGVVYWCYLKNKSVDGSEFLDRFLAFSVANALRVFIFTTVYTKLFITLNGHSILPFSDELITPLAHAIRSKLIEIPVYLFFGTLIRRDLHLIGVSRNHERRHIRKTPTWRIEGFIPMLIGQFVWLVALVQLLIHGKMPLLEFFAPVTIGSFRVPLLVVSFALLFLFAPWCLFRGKLKAPRNANP